MKPLRLLQVCNVGDIVGGTAACAWTVTRALPEFEHVVAFLSEVTARTRAAFHHVNVERWRTCSLHDVDQVRPDVVILHNIVGRRAMSWSAITVQYVHSAGPRAPADVTVCCSRWLARTTGRPAGDVLYQGVPRAPRPTPVRARGTDGRLVIGRLCTPIIQKWPKSMFAFYANLAGRFPEVEWEFVGCPRCRRSELQAACGGRVRFFPAGWDARRRLWEWDALLYHNPGLTESFGRTVAESLRASCVPIVDARGGFVEQVTPQTGFLCTTVDEFAASVTRLRDAAVRQRMSSSAREQGDRRFSIARFRGELLRRIGEASRRR